ncbi:MAG: lysophospholipid acyltransferase family protein [Bacteroidales bacterium]|jgi:1-acyl-sn-glycerol-3-phosphate acyltransferase
MDIFISVLVWLIFLPLAGLFFLVSLMVWFITFPFDDERKIMHWWLVCQSNFFSYAVPLWKIKVEGREKALKSTPYIIISNHQSILDILILNCLRYRFKWISKIENFRVPVIGWYLSMAKYITVDRGNKESKAEMMERSAESLKKGISIMIFPEGTRSLDGEIGPLKLGAFQMAMMTDKSILPVVIEGTGGVLPKHGLVFSRNHILRIKVLEPVHPGSFGTSDPEELASKFRSLMGNELAKMRNGLQ